MLGRTPDEILAIRPLKDGVIADFTATQLMLKSMIQKYAKDIMQVDLGLWLEFHQESQK